MLDVCGISWNSCLGLSIIAWECEGGELRQELQDPEREVCLLKKPCRSD